MGLAAAAAEVGLDVAAARAYYEDEDNWALIRSTDRSYKQAGIGSVPYFMVNGAGVFAGARPPEQLVSHELRCLAPVQPGPGLAAVTQ